MSVRVLDARLRGGLVEARIPFRFGIAEMNELIHVVLFATVDIDGVHGLGVAADNLSPKWFTKNPETSYRDDVGEMIRVIESACSIALECGSTESVFELWHEVHYEQASRGAPDVAPLLAGFGVSLVERATIDAFCRSKEISFAEAVRENRLGIRLGDLHATLSDRDPREFLPRRPVSRMRIRHTVGLSDSLVGGESAGTPADDLPATLEACVREYGLRRFKLKVSGNHQFDLDRLGRIREVLDRETQGDYRITLDGNEQFVDVSALRAFWDNVIADSSTAELSRRIDYVEQPLPRDLALSADTSAGLAEWPERPRLIIDESDDSLDAVARAVEAGYHGGSFKSSKGVFKGIGNACRLQQLRQEDPRRGFIYSAEDNSTIGPVGLLADLAVIATLGIDEPERNGHHYLRPFAGLSGRVHEETLRHHGDLFSRHTDGSAVVRIRDGTIDIRSVVAAPFGVGWPCDFEQELDSVDALVAAII